VHYVLLSLHAHSHTLHNCTDHAGAYTNKYYHSRFDDAAAQKTGYARRVCAAATLTARTLYTEAARGDDDDAAATAVIDGVAATIHADCDVVAKVRSTLNCDT
jgi:hypothetical protein